MTKVDLVLKMFSCMEIDPPLQMKEIFDFVLCEVPNNGVKEMYEALEKVHQKKKDWWKMDYTTKKRINEEIKKTNTEIEGWMQKKRKKTSAVADIEIEDCLEKKKKLRARAASLGKFKPSDEKERARLVPITEFMEFNNAGFAVCLWHSEKTPSLHLLPTKNAAWCFSCGTRYDSIAAVMKIHGVDFNKAVHIILGK